MSKILKFDKDQLCGANIHIHKKIGDTSYIAHRHDYYEMIFYQNCGGICVLNGEEHKITENCLFLLTPNDYHRIDAQNTNISKSTVISFSENAVDEELIGSLAFCPRVWHDLDQNSINMINALCSGYFSKEKRRDLLMIHLLNALLCRILDAGAKLKMTSEHLSPTVLRAMTLVLTDISANVTLGKVANECKMTPAYFSSVFSKEMGKSFIKWLTEVRIEHAKRFLENSESDILEICYECGYNTPSQFIKMFKRETGITPSGYRKTKISSKNANNS